MPETPLEHITFINELSSLPNISENGSETVHNFIVRVTDFPPLLKAFYT